MTTNQSELQSAGDVYCEIVKRQYQGTGHTDGVTLIEAYAAQQCAENDKLLNALRSGLGRALLLVDDLVKEEKVIDRADRRARRVDSQNKARYKRAKGIASLLETMKVRLNEHRTT